MSSSYLFLAWRFWQEEEELTPVMRSPTSVVLHWRCPAGHEFEDRGQVEPRACPTCGKLAYPVTIFHCPRHGPIEVAVRYAENAGGELWPSEYRIGARKWVPAKDGLHCPRCKQELFRKPVDPFARKPRAKKKRG